MSKVYIYGQDNGALLKLAECSNGCSSVEGTGCSECPNNKTHWDSRIEVTAFDNSVQIGIMPASDESTVFQGVWKNEDGQFLSLSRGGVQRLIRALRDFRNEAFGADE